MPLTVSSFFVDAGGSGIPNQVIRAAPLAAGFFESFSGTYKEVEAGYAEPATTGADGSWSIVLPWPSTSSGGQWSLIMPDATAYVGVVPEGVSGPLAPKDLVSPTYGWTITVRSR